MASISVRVDDFEDGALPPVCAATGGPADRLYRFTASYKPSWPIVFIVLGPIGWLVMIVVAVGCERRVHGSLPFADAVQQHALDERQRAYRIGAGITVGAVLLVFSLVAFGYGWSAFITAVAGLCTVTCALTIGSRPAGSVALSLSRNGRAVEVRQVAQEFADACRLVDEARRTARQAEARVSP